MNLLTPLATWMGAIPWLPRFLRQITAIDGFIRRVTRGRWTLLRIAGLPDVLLTVTGRKSGISRSTPLLCVPWRQGVLVAGSNFGHHRPPAWVFNVRAAERVTIRYRRTVSQPVPRELDGAERAQAWEEMLRIWPNYAKYAERTDRKIPVFYLELTG